MILLRESRWESKSVQAEIRTENPEIENLELDLFAWEFKKT